MYVMCVTKDSMSIVFMNYIIKVHLKVIKNTLWILLLSVKNKNGKLMLKVCKNVSKLQNIKLKDNEELYKR